MEVDGKYLIGRRNIYPELSGTDNSLWHSLQLLMDHLSSLNCIFLLLHDQVNHP